MFELRPYQQEAKDAILGQWREGNKRTLLVLPTGTGKTIVFAEVAEECVQDGKRVLILAHRGELLDQARDKIRDVTGIECALEKAEQSSIGTWNRITVGSVQSMMQSKRLDQFPGSYFETIIVDEAHHVLSNSYQKVLEHFPGADVLGVTATPDRSDMRNLGQYFDSLAYEYTLPSAIREGYLCPIRAMMIPLEIDISSVGTQNGDFKNGELSSAIDPYLEAIADEMVKCCRDRKTVVFLPLIATSKKFRDILNSKGFHAAEINGNSADRKEKLADFEKGKYNVLCNSMLLTEGWDCPSVDCIIVLRPTKIRSLYAQMVGRGTRLCESKDYLLLPDFLWHTERHELCHPAHLICTTGEVAKKMTENLERASHPVDIEEAEEAAKKDVLQERENSLAEQLEQMKKRKSRLVDPIQFELSIEDSDLTNYIPTFGWEMMPPSEKQVRALESFGIRAESVENAGKASALISRMIKRSNEKLSTPRQIRCLENYGFRHVGTWTSKEAGDMIGRISGNRWHVPKEIVPEIYSPSRKTAVRI